MFHNSLRILFIKSQFYIRFYLEKEFIRSVHTKDVSTENNCNFEPEVEKRVGVPFYVIIKLRQGKQFRRRTKTNDTF